MGIVSTMIVMSIMIIIIMMLKASPPTENMIVDIVDNQHSTLTKFGTPVNYHSIATNWLFCGFWDNRWRQFCTRWLSLSRWPTYSKFQRFFLPIAIFLLAFIVSKKCKIIKMTILIKTDWDDDKSFKGMAFLETHFCTILLIRVDWDSDLKMIHQYIVRSTWQVQGRGWEIWRGWGRQRRWWCWTRSSWSWWC